MKVSLTHVFLCTGARKSKRNKRHHVDDEESSSAASTPEAVREFKRENKKLRARLKSMEESQHEEQWWGWNSQYEQKGKGSWGGKGLSKGKDASYYKGKGSAEPPFEWAWYQGSWVKDYY